MQKKDMKKKTQKKGMKKRRKKWRKIYFTKVDEYLWQDLEAAIIYKISLANNPTQ